MTVVNDVASDDKFMSRILFLNVFERCCGLLVVFLLAAEMKIAEMDEFQLFCTAHVSIEFSSQTRRVRYFFRKRPFDGVYPEHAEGLRTGMFAVRL